MPLLSYSICLMFNVDAVSCFIILCCHTNLSLIWSIAVNTRVHRYILFPTLSLFSAVCMLDITLGTALFSFYSAKCVAVSTWQRSLTVFWHFFDCVPTNINYIIYSLSVTHHSKCLDPSWCRVPLSKVSKKVSESWYEGNSSEFHALIIVALSFPSKNSQYNKKYFHLDHRMSS